MATQDQFNQLPVWLQNQITSALKSWDKVTAQRLLEEWVTWLWTPTSTATVTKTSSIPSTSVTPTISWVQDEYKKLVSSWVSKEDATNQLKTKLQWTQTTAWVSAYDKLKAQYNAPSNLKVTKTDVTVKPVSTEIYKATNWASYNLSKNPDWTVSFISAQTWEPRVFKNREEAVWTIELVAQTNKAKDILNPKDVWISEAKVTELSWVSNVANKAKTEKSAMVKKITNWVTLTAQDQSKIDTLQQLSDADIKAEEDNLANYTAQLKQSTADIVNMNNRRTLELQNQMNEKIKANKDKVDQNTSIVLSQLWGRAKALSQIIWKDWRPLDDASMIALMWDTWVTAMQWIVDAKNKAIDANNQIKTDAQTQIFDLEQKWQLAKSDAEKAIFALEYQSKLNNAKTTKDFYNSIFWVVDEAKKTSQSQKIAIQDSLVSTLSWFGLTPQEIWLVQQELWPIIDPTLLQQKIYDLSKKQWSQLYKAIANAKKRATAAAQSKLVWEIAVKQAWTTAKTSALPTPSADNINTLSVLASKTWFSFKPEVLANWDSFNAIITSLNSPDAQSVWLVIPWSMTSSWKDIKLSKQQVMDLSWWYNAKAPNTAIKETIKTTPTIITTNSNDLRDTNIVNKLQEENKKKIQASPSKKWFLAYSDWSWIIYTWDNKYTFINNKWQVEKWIPLWTSPKISNVQWYNPDINQINKNNEAIRKLVADWNSYWTIVYPWWWMITFTWWWQYVYQKPDWTKSLPTPINSEPIFK